MTNLTEQYRNGELPVGTYYVKYSGNNIPSVDIYRRVYSLYDDSVVRFTLEQINEILAEVPSYEEYQKLLSDQLAKNEGAEINAELEERLKKTQKLELDLRRENRKLKKLLERVNEHFKWVDFDDNNYVNYELWDDIKKVLGEE